MLFKDEQLEDLRLGGLSLIQKKRGFRFGVDAVILADFAAAKKKDTVLDLGTGSGIIPILIANNFSPKKVVGVEILPHYAEMAARSVSLNNLQSCEIIAGDYREAVFPPCSFSLVVSNPPYKKAGSGAVSTDQDMALAKCEINATLEDVIKAAAYYLMPGGRFCMVLRPERLSDSVCLMRRFGLEPKRLRMVESNSGKAPSLFLIEGLKGGKSGIKILSPLVIFENGGESAEIKKIYRREQ